MSKHVGEKCGKLHITYILSSERGITPSKIDAKWRHSHLICSTVKQSHVQNWRTDGWTDITIPYLTIIRHVPSEDGRIKNYGTMCKVLLQGIHMCNMRTLPLLVWKLWPKLKFSSTQPTRTPTLGLWHKLPGHSSRLAKKELHFSTLFFLFRPRSL